MGDRIGEFLVRIGAMLPDQVDAVVKLQASGDGRTFGEIATGLGYITDDQAVEKYLEYQEKLLGD